MDRALYIVDDNPDHHFLIYKVLKQLDKSYSPTFFESGKALYRHLDTLVQQHSANLPGLIILDLNMPGMSGMDLLTLIKRPTRPAHAHLKEIPVVVMSNDSHEETIRQCYQYGADAYIIKPFEYEKVKSTMRGVCKFWLSPHPIS